MRRRRAVGQIFAALLCGSLGGEVGLVSQRGEKRHFIAGVRLLCLSVVCRAWCRMVDGSLSLGGCAGGLLLLFGCALWRPSPTGGRFCRCGRRILVGGCFSFGGFCCLARFLWRLILSGCAFWRTAAARLSGGFLLLWLLLWGLGLFFALGVRLTDISFLLGC